MKKTNVPLITPKPVTSPVGCYVYAIETMRYTYIGKGTARKKDIRAWKHIEQARLYMKDGIVRDKNPFKNNVIAKSIREKRPIVIRIIRDGLTDDDAKALEVKMIAKVPKRWSLNLTLGGDGFDVETCRQNGKVYGPVGGRAAGRIAIESGRWHDIQQSGAGGRIGGKIAGRKHVESGHWARILARRAEKNAELRRIDREVTGRESFTSAEYQAAWRKAHPNYRLEWCKAHPNYYTDWHKAHPHYRGRKSRLK